MKRLTKEIILRCLVIAGFFIIVDLMDANTSLAITKPYEKQKTESEKNYPQDVQHKLSGVYPNRQMQSREMRLLFAQKTNDSAKVDTFKSSRRKSPWIALGMALVPGAIIHGAGHFYAGKTTTGFLLLGAEGVGAYLVFLSAIASFPEGEDGADVGLSGFVGFVLFAGSWVYDVVGSPIAVVKTNKDLLQGKHSGLKLQIKDENLKLVVIWRF